MDGGDHDSMTIESNEINNASILAGSLNHAEVDINALDQQTYQEMVIMM